MLLREIEWSQINSAFQLGQPLDSDDRGVHSFIHCFVVQQEAKPNRVDEHDPK